MMRLAKTSVVHFISQVGTSLIGFVATIYFARELGASVLGQYFVLVALIAWLSIPTNGIGAAITKRMSEGSLRGEFMAAGFALNWLVAIFVALGAFSFQARINAYIGAPVAELFALLYLGQVTLTSVYKSLSGQQKVAQEGLLTTFDRVVRVGSQVAFIWLGYGVIALVGGHALALLVASVAGLALFEVRPAIPERRHFRELITYARYSWIGETRNKAFGWMDTLILSLFVGSGLIGVYEISWRLASILVLLSVSVRQTLFPEISQIATADQYNKVRHLVNEGLFAAGIFTIPGFFGALILGPKILRIYGPEFVQGGTILLILIAARMLDAYGTQLVSAIYGIDRPDIAFKIDLSFVVTNLVLNVGLIYLFGWIGAAVATALSSLIMLALGLYGLSTLFGPPDIPLQEILRQVIAGAAMAVLIVLIRTLLPWQNMYVTTGLVFTGAVIYGLVLLTISSRFRQKAEAVIPGRLSVGYR